MLISRFFAAWVRFLRACSSAEGMCIRSRSARDGNEAGSAAIGETDTDKNQIPVVFLEHFLRLGDGAAGGPIHATLPQLLLQIFSNDQVVLKHYDFFNRHGLMGT